MDRWMNGRMDGRMDGLTDTASKIFFSVEREKRAKIRMNFEIAKDRHEIKLNSEKQ